MELWATHQIRNIEKRPSERKFREFLAEAAAKSINLSAWEKRLGALRIKVLLHEVMAS